MIKVLISLSILLISQTTQFASESLLSLHFLEGTWKVEGKQSYERWQLLDNQQLKGVVFKYKNNNEKLSEEMILRLTKKNIILEARVLNQNNGKSVAFLLTNVTGHTYTFENKNHDFPNKIIYSLINSHQLQISVFNNDNEGFSYKMSKLRYSEVTNMDLTLKMFSEFNRHDWESMLSYYTKSVLIKSPGSQMEYVKKNKEQLLKEYQSYLNWCPTIYDEVISIYAQDEIVIVEFIAQGCKIEGADFRLAISSILHFKDGKIYKESNYYDKFNE